MSPSPLGLAFVCALAGAIVCGCGGGPGSIGAVLGRDKDTRALWIREVPTGLAADKAGLLPDDQIVMIDGVWVKGLDSQQIRTKLRGDAGTAVRLTILRGNAVHHVQVTRGELRDRPAPRAKEERIAD